MTEEKVDLRKLELLTELQQAYQNLGAKRSGPAAERYHRALARYVEHLLCNGGAPEALCKTLAWWDERCGVVETSASEQLALL